MKYTFPVVRAALDKVGLPREIGKVPSPQAGPLLVTLAMDVSNDCCRDICLSLEATAAGGPASEKCLIPDLYEGATVRSEGAGQILLKTNARWWTQFATVAEARFRNLAQSTGPLRLLLRSAIARAAAEGVENGKITYDSAWLELAKNPQDHFSLRLPAITGLNSLDATTIRKWRSILMQEDAEQKHWIQRTAGCSHPTTSSYWDDSSHPPADYAGWRPRNELYYCLANGVEGWTCLESPSFSASKWRAWLSKAAKTPPYWHPK